MVILTGQVLTLPDSQEQPCDLACTLMCPPTCLDPHHHHTQTTVGTCSQASLSQIGDPQ